MLPPANTNVKVGRLATAILFLVRLL